jgi:DNA-binding NtrC family response regulator
VNNLKAIYDRPELEVTPSAVNWLTEQAWPGNIRELKNLVERTVLVVSGDKLNVDHFKKLQSPDAIKAASDDLPAVGLFTIEEMEMSMIKKAFEYHGRNISKVARSLGISRTALYRRLEKYGISI